MDVNTLNKQLYELNAKVERVLTQNESQSASLMTLSTALESFQLSCAARHAALDKEIDMIHDKQLLENGAKQERQGWNARFYAGIVLVTGMAAAVFAGMQWLIMR